MGQDPRYDIAYQLISDILAQQDMLLSVNSGSGIAEARVEKGLPFRIKEKWATIGDEDRPWHIHLNMDEVVQARFVKGPKCKLVLSHTNRRTSFCNFSKR